MDIEGTTTRISFVKDVLFPYAHRKMHEYLLKNTENLIVVDLLKSFNGNVEAASEHMKQLIEKDIKDPILKQLQGHIWKEGYDCGELIAHIYPDVLPALQKWKTAGLQLGIYSSGSVVAQKLLFGHTEYGDLNTMLSTYYDLGVGKKIEPDSYRNIVADLKLEGSEVVFLSDIGTELDAARAVGLKTYQLFREIPIKSSGHNCVKSFEEIIFEK